jgi:hypothetical protein
MGSGRADAGDLISFRPAIGTCSRQRAICRGPADRDHRRARQALKRGDVAAFKTGRTGARRASSADFACDGRLAEPILKSLPDAQGPAPERHCRLGKLDPGVESAGRDPVRRWCSHVFPRFSFTRRFVITWTSCQRANRVDSRRCAIAIGRTLRCSPRSRHTVDRRARPKGRPVAFRAGPAVHRDDRLTTDAIPHPLADLARGRAVARE